MSNNLKNFLPLLSFHSLQKPLLYFCGYILFVYFSSIHNSFAEIICWGVGLAILLRLTSRSHLKFSQSEKYYLSLLLILGYTIRFLHFILFPPLFGADADERVYWDCIVKPINVLLGTPERPPGYSLFGKLIYFGYKNPNPTTLYLVQVWINSYGIYQIYRIGSYLFNKPTGFIAAVFFVGWLPFIDMCSSKLLTETVSMFLFLQFCLMCSQIIAEGSNQSQSQLFRRAMGIGFLIGLSLITRPSSLFMVPIVIICGVLSQLPFRRLLKFLTACAGGSVIFPLAIALKNFLFFGVFAYAMNSAEFLLVVAMKEYRCVPRFCVLNETEMKNVSIQNFDSELHATWGPLFVERLPLIVPYNRTSLDTERAQVVQWLINENYLDKNFKSIEVEQILRAFRLPPKWQNRLESRVRFNQTISSFFGKQINPETHREHIHWIMSWHLLNSAYKDLWMQSYFNGRGLYTLLSEISMRCIDYWKFPPYMRTYSFINPMWSLHPLTVIATDIQHWFCLILAPFSFIIMLSRSFSIEKKNRSATFFCASSIIICTVFFAAITLPEFRYMILAWNLMILLAAFSLHHLILKSAAVFLRISNASS